MGLALKHKGAREHWRCYTRQKHTRKDWQKKSGNHSPYTVWTSETFPFTIPQIKCISAFSLSVSATSSNKSLLRLTDALLEKLLLSINQGKICKAKLALFVFAIPYFHAYIDVLHSITHNRNGALAFAWTKFPNAPVPLYFISQHAFSNESCLFRCVQSTFKVLLMFHEILST